MNKYAGVAGCANGPIRVTNQRPASLLPVPSSWTGNLVGSLAEVHKPALMPLVRGGRP